MKKTWNHYCGIPAKDTHVTWLNHEEPHLFQTNRDWNTATKCSARLQTGSFHYKAHYWNHQ